MSRTRPTLIGAFVICASLSPEAWSVTLKDVIKTALNNHPEARAGLIMISAEREKVSRVQAEYLPSLDVSAGVGGQKRLLPPTQRTENSVHNKSYTRKEGQVSLRQNIFSGFNTVQRVAEARYISTAESYRLSATLEGLALKVANAYLKVLEQTELLELAEANLRLHDDIFQQVKKKADQGLSRSSDLTQVEGRRARANANVVNARNNLADYQVEYHALVGSQPAELSMPDTSRLSLPKSLEDNIKVVLKEHPAIQSIDHEIMAADAGYKAQKSNFLPSLNLNVEQKWRTNADGQLNTTQDLQVMAQLSYNLFRGGADLSQIRESAYRAEEKRAQKDRLLRNIEEQLRLAWDSYQFVGEQLQYLYAHEEASKKTVEAYREQFQIGKRTLLDLLDTENELFQASQSLTQAIYQESYARYRVLAASGLMLNTLGLNRDASWAMK